MISLTFFLNGFISSGMLDLPDVSQTSTILDRDKSCLSFGVSDVKDIKIFWP